MTKRPKNYVDKAQCPGYKITWLRLETVQLQHSKKRQTPLPIK